MTLPGDANLKTTYEKYSARAESIARLIIVGLVMEIATVFILGKPWSEATLTILSNTLIVVGVWGEIIFEKRAKEAADGIVAEANARAAEANQKAQEAALELVKIRQPRGLTPEARGRIVEKLWRLAPLKFNATANPGDPEFVQCLRHIELALQEAGWTQIDWEGSGAILNRSSVGLPNVGATGSVRNVAIFFLLEDSSNRYQERAVALADALMAEGIVADARVVLAVPTELATHPPIHITVGPKT